MTRQGKRLIVEYVGALSLFQHNFVHLINLYLIEHCTQEPQPVTYVRAIAYILWSSAVNQNITGVATY